MKDYILVKFKMIKTNFISKINLCYKILKTDGYTEDYTIKELLEDER